MFELQKLIFFKKFKIKGIGLHPMLLCIMFENNYILLLYIVHYNKVLDKSCLKFKNIY